MNNRYEVIPDRHLIRDRDQQIDVRLEPRIMQVLSLLAEHAGAVVPREVLTDRIWQGYGGAEEGLTQAISFLRKALQDSARGIIETVPKKGYILRAVVTAATAEVATPPPTGQRISPRYALIALIAFLLVMRGVQWASQKPMHEAHAFSTEVPYRELKAAEETYFNTITTTGPDGTSYRVVAIGDQRPKLYVNQCLVPESAMESYADITDKLLRQLWNRQIPPEGRL